MLKKIRDLGLEVTAETYAYQAFYRDIEELEAEELEDIPDFLLDDWNARQEREGAA